ncbi:hypothetical protein [Streptomyces sp. NPDC048385]|uniref:hypothetical protein n=1 Tax=unclassified Streptomyces TaxID=2593676 RepID=UPI00342DB3D6
MLSRLKGADIGKDEARQGRRLLSDAKPHRHEYAIDAVLAIIARQQKGQVTVFTSDVDDLEKLAPESIVVKQVRPAPCLSDLVSLVAVRRRPPPVRWPAPAAGQNAPVPPPDERWESVLGQPLTSSDLVSPAAA